MHCQLSFEVNGSKRKHAIVSSISSSKELHVQTSRMHFDIPSRMQNIWDGITIYIKWSRPTTKILRRLENRMHNLYVVTLCDDDNPMTGHLSDSHENDIRLSVICSKMATDTTWTILTPGPSYSVVITLKGVIREPSLSSQSSAECISQTKNPMYEK